MDIEEILEKKKQLEIDIGSLLIKFEKETGLLPHSVDVITYPVRGFGISGDKMVLSGVKAEVDLG